MPSGTQYNVNVKFLANTSGAAAPVSQLTSNVKDLTKANKEAGASFGVLGLAAAAGIGFGFHEARKALIDFNRDVENAKIGLSAMIQGNLGGSWDMANEKANRLYDTFQKFSTQTPVTTQEILTFGKAIAVSTFQAGGGINDLIKLTEQGVIAAKAFGYQSAYTSLELSEMLAGNVTNRMMFAKQILGMAHMDEVAFKALTADKRMAVVQKVLNSDAMKNAADSFSNSFSGVTSTFEDKLQIVFGKIGLPLFQAITKEVKSWNDWLESNKHHIDDIARSIGDGLVKGFGVVKDALSMLVSHSDLIMSMGKVWLAVQVGRGLGGAAAAFSGGVGGGVGGMFGQSGFFTKRAATDSIDPFTGEYSYTKGFTGRGRQDVTMGNIGGNLPLIAQAAAVGVAIGSMINEFTDIQQELHNLGLDKTTREFEKVQRASDSLAAAMAHAEDSMPGSAKAVTNLSGALDMQRMLANLARDALRGSTTESTEAGDVITRVDASKLKALYAMGVDQGDIDKAGGLQKFADAAQSRADQLGAQKGGMAVFGTASMTLGIQQLTDYQRQTLDEAKATQDVLVYINQTMSKGLMINPSTIMDILRHDTDDPNGTHKPLAAKPNVTVHIARIEVQSDDPDRIAFGLVESFRDAAKNPSSAFAVLREG